MEKKTLEQLKKLNDNRLLSYFKSIRAKTQKYINSFYCDCCGEFEWEVRRNLTESERKHLEEDTNKKIKEAKDYFNLIKSELDKRGNVE